MPPAIIAAGVAAAGQATGAILGSRANNHATDAQARATREAMQYQRLQEERQRADARFAYTEWQRMYGGQTPGGNPVAAAPAAAAPAAPAAPVVTPASPGAAPVATPAQSALPDQGPATAQPDVPPLVPSSAGEVPPPQVPGQPRTLADLAGPEWSNFNGRRQGVR